MQTSFIRSAGALIVSSVLLSACGGGKTPGTVDLAQPDPVQTPGSPGSPSNGSGGVVDGPNTPPPPVAEAAKVDAPVAIAGWDRSAAPGETVTLDGSASRDPNHLSLNYNWTQIGGPSIVLGKAATPTITFVAPSSTVPTELVFQLTVSNPLGHKSYASIRITISPPYDDGFYAKLCLDVLSIKDLCAGAVRENVGRFNGLAVLDLQAPRGHLLLKSEAPRAPSAKIVDGDPSDWIGKPTRFGGTMRLDAGEMIYTDYVYDAYGADDGVDAQRLEVLDPLATWEQRTYRLDQLFQAAGDQFGAPAPFGALDRYGDTTSLDDQADLSELRFAADATNVYLLARFTTLTDASKPALLVLLDTDAAGHDALDAGFGSGLHTTRFEKAVLLTRDGAQLRDLATGATSAIAGASVAVNAASWTNAFEASLPRALLANAKSIAVISGPRTAGGIKAANVAFRVDEPVAGVYNDKAQALALFDGSVDAFATSFDPATLAAGATQSFSLGAGYYEKQFDSGDNISREQGEEGRIQPYGLYVPTGYDPATPSRLTFWLHYRGGKAHSGAAWTPRLLYQLGEQRNNLVITPRGRGTSTWYVTRAHQDFFEVFNDAAGTAIAGADRYANQPQSSGFLNVDPLRIYLSGYSMGGYGTYLFGLLYPDLFAGGFSSSGAMTQGAWTGYGPDDARCTAPPQTIPVEGDDGNLCFIQANEGDADAQLTYRILENARQFPIVINHGSNDELVPITGVQRIGERLLELGYRYDLEMYFGYEHYTQAIIDQWDDGANYLNHFARPANARHVTYKTSPSLIRALNTVRSDGVSFSFHPDGAWWVSGVAVRNANPADPTQTGMIDAESMKIAANKVIPVPMAVDTGPGVISTPIVSPTGQSTPYLRHGQDWVERNPEPIANAFNARLINLGAATLDVTRMQLDLTQRVDGAVTSDGDTALTLENLAQPVQVFVNGFSYTGSIAGGQVTLPIPSGINHVVMVPPGAPAPVDLVGGTVDISATCHALGDAAAPLCDRIDTATTLLFNGCNNLLDSTQLCAIANGNLHSLIDQCRRSPNHAERVCKSAEQVLYGLASACRLQAGVPAQFCALLAGDLITSTQVAEYEKGWTARALQLQRALGDGIAFHDAEFPATHNSFNWTTANDPPTISGSDPNQKYSIPDQLRMGIRAIEVDVHWMPGIHGTAATQFREPMVCHGNANHAGCTYERPLVDVLNELRDQWLDLHPDQVIILYLEEHLDEQVDDASISFDTTSDVIENILGASSAKDLIFRPAQHGSTCDDDTLPLATTKSWITLTRSQILGAGKQVLIFTGSCGTGTKWPALAHNKDAHGGVHYTETSESDYAGFAYPSCKASDGEFSASQYATKWTRFFEDSTWLSAMVNGPSIPMNADQVHEMMRCGVNMPSLDQVEPSDARLPALVWSWRQGEPQDLPNRNCARHAADGRFVAEDCATPLRFACVNPSNPRDWKISATADAWSGATCPSGYVFATPRTGNYNEALREAKSAASAANVWINYRRAGDWSAH